MDATAQQLAEHLGMTQLPVEATYFVSTYRSEADTVTGGPVGTAMIGMYSNDPPSRSLFHRLLFDEVWHFYGGDPLRLVLLHSDGSSDDVTMGADLLAGQCVQYVIPAGVWQAGELVDGGRWALFGCTMAPGFTGTCFEGGRVGDLLAIYPDRAADIHKLGIPDDHGTSMPEGFAT
ncbi:MAG TPA: cupin domain-containing protein [Ilumatobacteraceae bacterium]|nr:cupin domain-containing protein [Ilumatobacteraceae bacterium]